MRHRKGLSSLCLFVLICLSKIIDAKILPILNVLDKIHDPYEGEDLSGHDSVDEHVQGIASMQ